MPFPFMLHRNTQGLSALAADPSVSPLAQRISSHNHIKIKSQVLSSSKILVQSAPGPKVHICNHNINPKQHTQSFLQGISSSNAREIPRSYNKNQQH